MMPSRRAAVALGLFATSGAGVQPASAQPVGAQSVGAQSVGTQPVGTQLAWAPSGPIHLIVPFPPGGTMDVVARMLEPALRQALGQPIVVDNRPGAGTVIGTEVAARAAPDGLNLLMMANSFLINGSLQPSLPYHPLRDFAAVALLTDTPHVLVVHPGVARDFPGFLAAARSRRGLTFGSYGIGTSNHLGAEQLKILAGLNATHVPYRGGAQAYPDLLAGRIDFIFANLPDLLQQIAAGRLRALAIAAAGRSAHLAEVPTFAEQGFPQLVSSSWFGLVGPAALRPEMVARLSAAWLGALARPEIRSKLTEQGIDVVGLEPAAFAARMQGEFATYAEVIRTAGLKPE